MDLNKSIIDFDPEFTRIYTLVSVDLEFTRLPFKGESGLEWLDRVEVLSLGMATVDHSGNEWQFYGRRMMTRDVKSRCSAFVVYHVLPYLDRGKADTIGRGEEDLGEGARKALAGLKNGKPIALVSDWAGDLALCAKLLGDATPDLVLGEDAVQRGLKRVPDCRRGLIEHHALDDAIRNARALGILAPSDAAD